VSEFYWTVICVVMLFGLRSVSECYLVCDLCQKFGLSSVSECYMDWDLSYCYLDCDLCRNATVFKQWSISDSYLDCGIILLDYSIQTMDWKYNLCRNVVIWTEIFVRMLVGLWSL